MFSKSSWRRGPWAVFGNGTTKGAAGTKGEPDSAKPKRRRTAARPRPAPRPLDGIHLPEGDRVICGYPPVELSPNARVHWSVERRVAAAYRQDCWALALAAKIRAPQDGPIRIRLDFFPPTRARRDDDNAEAAFKAGRDGIAKALQVDDSRFRIQKVWHTEPLSCVVFTILPDDQVLA